MTSYPNNAVNYVFDRHWTTAERRTVRWGLAGEHELRKSTENCGCTHRTVGGNGIAGEGGIVGKGLRGEGCSVHPRPFAAFPTGSTLGLWPRPRSRPEPCAFLRSYTTFVPSWPFLFLLGLHGHYPWTHPSIPSCPLRIVGEDPLWGDRIVEAGTLGKDKELW